MRLSLTQSVYNARHFRVYRRLIATFTVIVLLAVCASGGVLYKLFSDATTSQITQSTLKMLSQVSYSATVVYDQAGALTNVVLRNPTVLNFLAMGEDEKVTRYLAQLELANYKAAHPYILDISLYNEGVDVEVASTGRFRNRALFQDALDSPKLTPRRIFPFLSSQRDTSVMTLSYIYPVNANLRGLNGGVVIDFDEEYVKSTITGITGSDGMDKLLIVDADGVIISYDDPAYMAGEKIDAPFVEEILVSGSASGSAEIELNGEKTLLAYHRISLPLSWCFISLTPMAEVLKPIDALLRTTLLVILAVAIVLLIISYAAAQRVYNPIKELTEKAMSAVGIKGSAKGRALDEYHMLSDAFGMIESERSNMQSSLNRSRDALRVRYLSEIVRRQRKIEELPADMADEVKQRYSAEELTIVLVEPLPENGLPPSDGALMRFSIGNIASDLAKGLPAFEAVEMGESVALVVGVNTPAQKDQLMMTAMELRSLMKEYFAMPIAIGIGHRVTRLDRLDTAYDAALNAVRRGFFEGSEMIFTADAIPAYAQTPFPEILLNQLLNALFSADTENAKETLAHWQTHLSSLSPEASKAQAARLTDALEEKFELTCGYDVRSALRFGPMWAAIDRHVQDILSRMEESKKDRTQQNNQKLVNAVLEVIGAEYGNPELSLSYLAQKVNLSPAYVGRVFKAQRGETVGDCLMTYRLERARMLLERTDETIGTIAGAVGLSNAAYFSTLFKKQYGYSPSHYRETCRMQGGKE